jgi:hypothetical protein
VPGAVGLLARIIGPRRVDVLANDDVHLRPVERRINLLTIRELKWNRHNDPHLEETKRRREVVGQIPTPSPLTQRGLALDLRPVVGQRGPHETPRWGNRSPRGLRRGATRANSTHRRKVASTNSTEHSLFPPGYSGGRFSAFYPLRCPGSGPTFSP